MGVPEGNVAAVPDAAQVYKATDKFAISIAADLVTKPVKAIAGGNTGGTPVKAGSIPAANTVAYCCKAETKVT